MTTLAQPTPAMSAALPLAETFYIPSISSILVLLLTFSTLSYASTKTYPHAPSPGTQSTLYPQPILQPSESTTIAPGTTFTITWRPSYHFSNITLELWDNTTIGYARNFSPTFSPCYHWNPPYCGSIAVNIPNSGSFDWQIPTPTGDPSAWSGENFRIKMYVVDYWKPDVGNLAPVLSFSDWFTLAM